MKFRVDITVPDNAMARTTANDALAKVNFWAKACGKVIHTEHGVVIEWQVIDDREPAFLHAE